MVAVSDEEFEDLIEQAFDALPRTHRDAVKNVALLFADDPSPAQREELRLRHDQTLFGLYEGVPLPRRQGQTSFTPDKITLFKNPLCAASASLEDLKERVRHTLWHEVAHYFGLDHEQIHALE